MRTMASVWFSVIVLVMVQEVFGNVCFSKDSKLSCDECIRCGGHWCNELGSLHCQYSLEDNWCPNDREKIVTIEQVKTLGDLINPIYVERTLYVGQPNTLQIEYSAITKTRPQVKINIVNSTQSLNFSIEEDVDGAKCTNKFCTNIQAMPNTDFCSTTGKTKEFVHVNVSIGGFEDVIQLKYHVPCACQCSEVVTKNSERCHKNGDLSCGVCTCHPGWTGADCGARVCQADSRARGDVPCINPVNDLECSGNGYCDDCNSCVCYNDREGSRYFDQENYCSDLCMVVSECDDCLYNNTIGLCETCFVNSMFSMYMEQYNSSLVEERDELNRRVWVKCNETVNGCYISYVAKRDDAGDVYVMVVESCNNVITAPVTANPEVPIILAVVGVLAAIAAVAGVMIWKHMNALPPVPLNDPGYQNIDAEDCIGENPLYKPPTSSFKNPTYGKW